MYQIIVDINNVDHPLNQKGQYRIIYFFVAHIHTLWYRRQFVILHTHQSIKALLQK